jgi:hypothetical protein
MRAIAISFSSPHTVPSQQAAEVVSNSMLIAATSVKNVVVNAPEVVSNSMLIAATTVKNVVVNAPASLRAWGSVQTPYTNFKSSSRSLSAYNDSKGEADREVAARMPQAPRRAAAKQS